MKGVESDCKIIVIINTRNWINCAFLLWFLLVRWFVVLFCLSDGMWNTETISLGLVTPTQGCLLFDFWVKKVAKFRDRCDCLDECECVFLLFEYSFFLLLFWSVLNMLYLSDFISIIKSIHIMALKWERKRIRTLLVTIPPHHPSIQDPIRARE